jgi:hypothetical protein
VDDPDRLSFLDRRLPPTFRVRAIAIEPGGARVYDEVEWRDTIVLVERGAIELECVDGGRSRFGRGDVLFLVGLPLRAVRNPGPEPAVLVAVSRRRPVSGSAP